MVTTAAKSLIVLYDHPNNRYKASQSSEFLDSMWYQCGHLGVNGIFGLSSKGEELEPK